MNEIDDAIAILLSMDEKEIRRYCKVHDIDIPKDDEDFWAGVHLTVCWLFLLGEFPIPTKTYDKSSDWLHKHDYGKEELRKWQKKS